MSADFSRRRFDPFNDYSAMLSQQGRVQLDADWNEYTEMLGRRSRAQTIDFAGRAAVSKETKDAFLIGTTGAALTIGLGRLYVDGLLADNHGAATAAKPLEFDAVLSELRGTEPLDFTKQPYLPGAALPTAAGTYLAYLDVCEREVTYLQQPKLIEQAVGIDSTARLQTVWQVKLLAIDNAGTCAAPGTLWTDLIRPSAGRLTNHDHGVPSKDDPCLIPPSAGYRGLENQLYRVQVHKEGGFGTASFKWSRENGSVETNITAINVAGDELTVVNTGRDDVLGFIKGGWIEITDDRRELAGDPGVMRRILDIKDRKITLDKALTSAELPDLKLHPRMQRWDQHGTVLDSGGAVLTNLDSVLSEGVIPIPAAPGGPVKIRIEHGIEVAFELDPPGGEFRTGDYWMFAARTADARIEPLVHAPPRGVHHHYAKLAIVTISASGALAVTADCREKPTDECCDCTVCVTEKSHKDGSLTIQEAVDRVVAAGGGTVCLGIGEYDLKKAVQIVGSAKAAVQSVRLKGQGWKTVVKNLRSDPCLVLSFVSDVVVQDLALFSAGRGDAALAIAHASGVTIQRCLITQIGTDAQDTAIALGGFIVDTFLRENVLTGENGILGAPLTPGSSITSGLCVLDNFILSKRAGLLFEKSWMHDADTRIAGNFFKGSREAALSATGYVPEGSRFDVTGNLIRTEGDGVVLGLGNARISDNDIGPDFESKNKPLTREGVAGIRLVLGETRIERCEIFGNRITGLGADGIRIETYVVSAMIKQNIIEGTGESGIVMGYERNSFAEKITIENNQLLDIAPDKTETSGPLVGVLVTSTLQAIIVGNTIVGLGAKAQKARIHAGIFVFNTVSVRIAGNHIREIAGEEFHHEAAGVRLAHVDRFDIDANEVQRSRDVPTTPLSAWRALHIGRPPTKLPELLVMAGKRVVEVHGSLVAFPAVKPTNSVRGNLFEAFGVVPPVEVEVPAACVFNANRCLLVSDPQTLPVVLFESKDLVFSANHVVCDRRPVGQPVAVLNVNPKRITVLGNITSDTITVAGFALAAKWDAINVILP